MAATLAFNPMAVTSGLGMFDTQSIGYVQGDYQVNPTARTKLQGGQLASTETIPMWGGRPVQLYVPATSGQAAGGNVASATTNAQILGFSTFSQATGMVQSAQSPCPLAGSYMTVNYFELGSGVYLALPIDAALAATLEGGLINQQVSWDFTNNQIIAYDAGIGALNVKIKNVQVGNSMTVSYASGTGLATWVRTGSCALVEL